MSRRSIRGFTLIELLVVILIIVLLIGISVTVGAAVVGGGRTSQATDVIRVLDTMLNDYNAREGVIPKPFVEDPHNPGRFMPIIDGRNMAVEDTSSELETPGFQMINSVGLFLFQLTELRASMESLEGIDARLRRPYTPYHEDTIQANFDRLVHEIPTIFDPWGNPIRYVHPAWDGPFWGDDPDTLPPQEADRESQVVALADVFNIRLPESGEWAFDAVRRNTMSTAAPGMDPERADEFADSDGGISTNQRPYFYSAGADGRVGFDDADGDGKLDPEETDWNEDNVYLTTPRFRH